MKKKIYIDISAAVNDTDALIKYIASDRSDGKTTHMIRLAFETWERTSLVGVIARRDCGEITSLMISTLFVNLKKVRPDSGDLTAKGSPKGSGVHLYSNGVEFAVVVPLTRSGKVKSAFDSATHRNLYIDEYVPLDGRYIKNEVTAILELYRTIDRDTDTNCIYVFSNHLTESNPLFDKYGVKPRKGVSYWKDGTFLLLWVTNKGNVERVKESRLGRLIAGTEYDDYAQGGTVNDIKKFIKEEHQRGRLPFLIVDARLGAAYGLYFASGGFVLDAAAYSPMEPAYTYEMIPAGPEYARGVYLKSTYAKEIFQALRNLYHANQLYVRSEYLFEKTKNFWKLLT